MKFGALQQDLKGLPYGRCGSKRAIYSDVSNREASADRLVDVDHCSSRQEVRYREGT